jgi:hypothetical protein
MHEPGEVTGHEDIDHVLHWFLAQAQALLGAEFVGMYLVGSLALGDFDPATSDIDFIIVSEAQLAPAVIAVLRDMHARFEQGALPWAGRIEAVYAERAALRTFPPGDQAYPQVESERGFVVEPLEMGWMFQCWTLRQHGVVLSGPAPKELIPPLDPDDMRHAAAPIARMWQREAREDPTWLPWLRERQSQAFVVLTLCRLLYTLDLADVASKPAAARWAQQSLGERWSTLIAGALAGRHAPGRIEPWEEQQTLALIDYTVACFHERLSPIE